MGGKKKNKNSTSSTSSTAATKGSKATDSGNTSTIAPDDLIDHNDEGITNDDGDNQEQQHDPVELLQVDTGDMVKVKQVLDEGVAAALLEYLPENTRWDNIKLLLMVVACIFAITAQFAPLPFPESRLVLGICGAAYFIVSGILQAIQTFIDKDAILWTIPMDDDTWSGLNKKKSDNINKKFSNPDLKQHGLLVRSSFPRFSEFFTVIIQFHIKQTNKKNDQDKPPLPPPSVSKTWSVGQFFDKEGYFDEVGLGMEVDKLFEKFDQQQYDTTIAPKGESKLKPKKD